LAALEGIYVWDYRLRRLEYRGYDSAGVAVLQDGRLETRKRQGRLEAGLRPAWEAEPVSGRLGLGHTRWATHGPPSDVNAHPHLDASGRIAVVHNGVVENFDSLKRRLADAGHRFLSTTDSEVLAHLIGKYYEKGGRMHAAPAGHAPGERLVWAVKEALRKVSGTYGLAVICADCPDLIVGARRGSPLILGVGKGEHFLASDASAIGVHTREVVYLNDYDVVTINAGAFNVTSLGAEAVRVEIRHLEFSAEEAEKGEFPHFMLKEIFEQPRTIRNALRGRLDHDEATARFGGLNMAAAELRVIDDLVIPACGTSWHAGLVGEYLLEELAHVPVEVEYASEFRYRHPPLQKHTLVLVITQSGETADTLAALRGVGGTRCWRSAMSLAARSRGRPTEASTCTPDRRSAWPPPRRSPRR
jgi:glutamine---fructose-6-phosphate transaminase (isomerizing)